ncbi:MAG: CDP-diacylglycerol--glycerol-3-phosphate 3-phosphatidyltransferase, partial [Clostridia bacterium]|nr:CDP-diacylglycerol--glycerol-3-phosphate 3-phosphatidyltransferase [Clostridia bacterium]
NILTVARVVFVPVFMTIVIFDLFGGVKPEGIWTRLIGAALFGLISLTDMVDGKLARKYNIVSDFGKFLDPLADKVLILGAMLALLIFMRDNFIFAALLSFATFIVIFRELAVTSLRLLCKNADGLVIAANKAGKIKTTSQMIFILAALLEPLIWNWLFNKNWLFITYAALAVMTFMTVYSGINYFRIYLPYLRKKDDQK